LALEVFLVERIRLLTESDLHNSKKLLQKHGPASYDMDIDSTRRSARQGFSFMFGIASYGRNLRDGVSEDHTGETLSVP